MIAKFPAKDIANWLGNSVPVAMKQYAMATDESFIAASGMNGGASGGALSAHQGTSSSPTEESENAVFPGKSERIMTPDSSRRNNTMAEAGLEVLPLSPGIGDEVDLVVHSVVQTDVVLRDLIHAWPRLSNDQKLKIRRIVTIR